MRVLVASLILSLALSVAAHADAAPKPELNDLQKAQAHFKLGKVHFDLAEYDKAIEEFDLAYRYQPLPLLLYNAGLAARRANRAALALERFHAFLREAPKAEERAEVEGYLPELERKAAEAPPATPAAPRPDAAPSAVAQPLVAQPIASRAPLYKRWWLWAAVGGAVAVGVGLGVGLSVGLASGSSFKPTLPDVSFGRAGLSFAF